MNLINKNLMDTMNTRSSQNKLSNMPKWARDERLYNCEPPDKKDSAQKKKRLDKILFWWAIVNLY